MKQLSENDAYENYYQFVGATKYRKPLFYDNEIRDRLSCIIADIFNKKEEIFPYLTVPLRRTRTIRREGRRS